MGGGYAYNEEDGELRAGDVEQVGSITLDVEDIDIRDI